MRRETIKLKINANCMSCKKATLHGPYDEQIFCEVTQSQTTDKSECEAWECDYNLFEILGVDAKRAEAALPIF